MKKKQNETVSIKDLATQILSTTYSEAEDSRDALCEAGIHPSGAAMMLMSILHKTVKNGDATCAKFLREAIGEADEKDLSRPLSQLTDSELEALMK